MEEGFLDHKLDDRASPETRKPPPSIDVSRASDETVGARDAGVVTSGGLSAALDSARDGTEPSSLPPRGTNPTQSPTFSRTKLPALTRPSYIHSGPLPPLHTRGDDGHATDSNIQKSPRAESGTETSGAAGAEPVRGGITEPTARGGNGKLRPSSAGTLPRVERSGSGAGSSVRGEKETAGDHKDSASLKSAGLAFVAVSEIKRYRRSSAALYTDLLRAFVPDVLINVSSTWEAQDEECAA